MRFGLMFGLPMWIFLLLLIGGGYFLWKRRSAA